jgi:plasmid stabilization system protein ParE
VSLPIILHRGVQLEIDEAAHWYEDQRPGLGRDFLDAVDQVMSDITVNPARFGFAKADIREGAIQRFPYVVYYRVLPDRIRVVAVQHTARDQANWASRN